MDYNVRRVVDSVHASLLDKSFSWGSPKLNIWKTPFYEIKVVAFVFLSLFPGSRTLDV